MLRRLLVKMADMGALARERAVGRIDYWDDPAAPKPNSLVPACGLLAAGGKGRPPLQRRRDAGQWALHMGKMEPGGSPGRRAGSPNRRRNNGLTRGGQQSAELFGCRPPC